MLQRKVKPACTARHGASSTGAGYVYLARQQAQPPATRLMMMMMQS